MSGYPEWGQSRAQGENAALTISNSLPCAPSVFNIRYCGIYFFIWLRFVRSNAQHSEQASLACVLQDSDEMKDKMHILQLVSQTVLIWNDI